MLVQDELSIKLFVILYVKLNNIDLACRIFSVLKISFNKLKHIRIYLQQGKHSPNLSSWQTEKATNEVNSP